MTVNTCPTKPKTFTICLLLKKVADLCFSLLFGGHILVSPFSLVSSKLHWSRKDPAEHHEPCPWSLPMRSFRKAGDEEHVVDSVAPMTFPTLPYGIFASWLHQTHHPPKLPHPTPWFSLFTALQSVSPRGKVAWPARDKELQWAHCPVSVGGAMAWMTLWAVRHMNNLLSEMRNS